MEVTADLNFFQGRFNPYGLQLLGQFRCWGEKTEALTPYSNHHSAKVNSEGTAKMMALPFPLCNTFRSNTFPVTKFRTVTTAASFSHATLTVLAWKGTKTVGERPMKEI